MNDWQFQLNDDSGNQGLKFTKQYVEFGALGANPNKNLFARTCLCNAVKRLGSEEYLAAQCIAVLGMD